MNVKIKFQQSELMDFQNIVTLMYNINREFLNYIEFYNVSSLLKKVSDCNFKNNFNNKLSYNITFNPNECECFLKLVEHSSNLLDQSPYHKAIVIEKCTNIHKIFSTLEHQKKVFVSNQSFDIPKKLN